jgi:hypothetical protein
VFRAIGSVTVARRPFGLKADLLTLICVPIAPGGAENRILGLPLVSAERLMRLD